MKFTTRPERWPAGLAGLKAERGTALYDSLIFSLYYFNGLKGRRAILLLSDGKDEGSRFTFEEALEFARRAGRDDLCHRPGRGAWRSGSWRASPRRPAAGPSSRRRRRSCPAIYAAIEEELRSQYLIAYQSTNTAQRHRLPHGGPQGERSGVEAKTMRGYYP